MAGHVFPALEQCTIIFPHHAGTIQAFQRVAMPTCSFLLYNSNVLQPLTHFHLPSLGELEVKSVQLDVWRGNPQLAALYPIFSPEARSLTSLHLEVACSTQLLVFMLRLVPALKQLWLGLASPNALRKCFFREFIVRNPDADCTSDSVGAPSQTVAPLCPSLESLHLDYRRWLRGPDKRALIETLSDIVTSRQRQTKSSFSLTLSFDGVPQEQGWKIGKPAREFQDVGHPGLALGISTSHAIIPISICFPERGLVPLPFKEAEYLQLRAFMSHPFYSYHLIHDYLRLVVHEVEDVDQTEDMPLQGYLLDDFPLFHALRVLVLEDSEPNFLIGHTFPRLERCRVDSFDIWNDGILPGETKMPVCTRVDIDDPYLLATFKLPQLHKLSLDFSDPNCSQIWEEHIAMNANLSGLILLHMRYWPSDGDLIPILRSLPLLESLIIHSPKGVVSLRALLPKDEIWTSELTQTRVEGKILALLCPRLQHLQIEVTDLVQSELTPFVKDVISLRAECGSPLKSFTLSEFRPEPGGRRLELIGKDGGFTMEEITLPEEAKRFALEI